MGILEALKKNPKYTFMRGVARFEAVRTGVAGLKSFMSSGDRRRESARLLAAMPDSVFAGVDAGAFLDEVRARGCAFGLSLPPSVVQSIRAYADSHPVFAFREEHKGFMPHERERAEQLLGKEILLAQYYNCQRDCAEIERLAADPLLNWIALNYLGSRPHFLGCNLWWTYPVRPNRADQVKHAHFFHRDIDDFRFLKFFFYLTEVESGDGAHWIVAGSHRKHPHVTTRDLFVTRRFEDSEIRGFYDAADILEVTGAPGSGFAEDTLCVHKAASPTRKPRLILQLQYALFDLGEGNDGRDPGQLRMVDGAPIPASST